jgi:predicted transcriptional regulator
VPTDLPKDVVLLVPVDADELDDDDRAALHRAIERGLEDVEAGRVIGEDELWEMLRQKRGA